MRDSLLQRLVPALFGLLVASSAISCKSESDQGPAESATPPGCPVRGDTVDLTTDPGSLFVRDIRFFTSIGDNPMVSAPQGKVFAIVRYVWTPKIAPVPPAPATATVNAAPAAPTASPAAPAGGPATKSANATAPAAAPAPATPPATASAPPPTNADAAAPAKAPLPFPEKITPPALQLVDRNGTPLAPAPEAVEAYNAMVEADPVADPLPTEFTGVWVMEPQVAQTGLFLLTPEKSADGSPIRFCMGRHQVETE